jgi:hypothetical protein
MQFPFEIFISGKFPGIKIILTTAAKIKYNTVFQIKCTSDYDEITSKLLKAFSSLISCPLNYICCHSL